MKYGKPGDMSGKSGMKSAAMSHPHDMTKRGQCCGDNSNAGVMGRPASNQHGSTAGSPAYPKFVDVGNNRGPAHDMPAQPILGRAGSSMGGAGEQTSMNDHGSANRKY